MKKGLSLLLAMLLLMTMLPLASAQSELPFVELKLLVPGDPPDDTTYLNKVQALWNEYLKEKLNCTVTIDFLTWNDWETNYNLKLMAGEGLDLITAGTWLDLWTNCSAGAFYDLTELLPEYAPNLYARLEPSEWEAMRYNGENLYIPQLWYAQWTDQGYAYRVDWAQEVGITEPITTFDQLSEYLLKVQAAAGTGTIPANINAFYTHNNRAENWYTYVTAKTDDMYMDLATGFTFILAYDMDEQKVYSPVFDDEIMKGYANLMKTWYDARVYNTDVLNCTDDIQARFVEGLTACMGLHTQSYTKGFSNTFYKHYQDDPLTPQDETNESARIGFFSPCDESNNLVTINPANDCIALSYTCKNPERAMMFMELLYSDPYLYRLMNYGIEGELYTIDADGYYMPIEKADWPEGEDRTFFTNMWGCRIDEFSYPSITWSADTEKINAHKMDIATVYPLTAFSFDSSMVNAEYAAMCDVVSQYMPLITYGQMADVDSTIEQFRAALKTAGIDSVINAVQQQVDAAVVK